MTNDEGSERPRKIVHVNMDAFYASVEQRGNPDPAGRRRLSCRPRRGGGRQLRGAKVRRSFGDGFGHCEAQMPRSDLRQTTFRSLQGHLVADPRDIRRVHADDRAAIARRGLSRCFRNPGGHGDSHRRRPGNPGKDQSDDRAQRLRRHLYNKFLAKMASGQNKPDGQFVITPKNGPAFVEQLPIKKFHGVGPATAEKMHRLGIETRADLKEQTLEFLVEHFGESGPCFYGIARGIDNCQVKADRVRKSVGAEDTSSEDIHSFEAAREGLQPLIEKVWSYCEANEISAKTVPLKVKYADFPDHPEQDGCGTFANDR